MEFKIAKDVFTKAFQKIQGIVEKKNTMPILSNALLEVKDNLLYVTATDLEVGMVSSYPTNGIKDGKVTVSAKKLYEILKELPDQEVHFSTKENDWIEIKCGAARFNIVGLSSEDFPYIPKVKEGSLLTFKSEILKDMIAKTSYAICDDETKYNLNGMFIKATKEKKENVLRMVTTDGHRLSLSKKAVSGDINPELSKGIIFPKKGVAELKKMVEESSEIMMGFMDNSAVFQKGGTVVVMRLIDGDFPDYEKVVPVTNDKIMLADRLTLLHALKRMAVLASDKFKGVKIELNQGKMLISSNNPELGDAQEELEVHYEHPAFSARYNANYLLDVLLSMECDDVEMNLKDELSPIIMKSASIEDFMAVVMPMRL